MKNAYQIQGDFVFIEIKYKGSTFKTKVSAGKLEKLLSMNVTWGASPLGNNKELYVTTRRYENGGSHTLYLHRYLLDAPKGMVVDHKNHDTLNNTDENIAVCTVTENLQNIKRARKNSKSGIKGVCFDKQTGRWKAHITVNRKTINLGRYVEVTDAIRAREAGEAKYFTYLAEIS